MENNESKKSFPAFIKNKKIPVAVPIVLVALATGFSGFYTMRGTLAMLSYAGVAAFNDILAYLFAAVAGLLEYELITFLVSRFSLPTLGKNVVPLRRDMRWFFAAAYFMSGLTKLLYFAFPFMVSYGEIFLDFLWCAVFFGLFIAYVCKNYYEPPLYGRITMYLGSTFLVLYGLIAAITLVSGVLA